MSNKTEEQDDVIRFFLTKFTEERLFKASAEQWLNSGKASGSFRDSLHNMLESWAASKNTWYKNEVASLESQLREKDERIKQYNMLLDPILDWGHSPESGLKLGQSITKEVLRMAKESKEKDRVIDALRKVAKDNERINENEIAEKDEEIHRVNVICQEKDKEIEAFKDIENIRSQATKNLCKENYDLRDEIERLKKQINLEIRGRDLVVFANNDLREALRELYLAFTGPDVLKPNHGLTDRCRKLIGE